MTLKDSRDRKLSMSCATSTSFLFSTLGFFYYKHLTSDALDRTLTEKVTLRAITVWCRARILFCLDDLHGFHNFLATPRLGTFSFFR